MKLTGLILWFRHAFVWQHQFALKLSVWLIGRQTQVIHNSDKWRRVLRVTLSHADASKQLYKLCCQMGPEGCVSSRHCRTSGAPSLTESLDRKAAKEGLATVKSTNTSYTKNFSNPTNACHLTFWERCPGPTFLAVLQEWNYPCAFSGQWKTCFRIPAHAHSTLPLPFVTVIEE